jgi:hypothetical protein
VLVSISMDVRITMEEKNIKIDINIGGKEILFSIPLHFTKKSFNPFNGSGKLDLR